MHGQLSADVARVAAQQEGRKPEYTVRLEIIEAENLVAADGGFLRRASSDPYVVVKDVEGLITHQLGDRRTKVIKKNLNPRWNQTFTLNFNYKLTHFKFKVMDSDKGDLINLDGDDFLGECDMPIAEFFGKVPTGQTFTVDRWMNLRKAKKGRLHVKAHITFNIPVAMPGTKIPLPNQIFSIGLAWDFHHKQQPIDLDASVIGFDHAEQVVDQVWYKKLHGFNGAISHSGDDRTGVGGGDDEVITVDPSKLDQRVEKLAVMINSYSLKPLSQVKAAYIRIVVNGRTHCFYQLGYGRVPNCTGLFFGAIARTPYGGWEFITTAAVANGRAAVLPECVGAVVQYGKQYLSW